MNLYPEDMEEIAKVIKALDTFYDSLFLKHLDIEPPIIELEMVDSTGKTIGHVGWTDDGEIGFIPKGTN